MTYKHACFISYRDHKTDIGRRIIEDLYKAISEEVEFYDLSAGVFFDRDRLKAGYFYNEALATALCESLCMVLVYTPSYFGTSSTYCAREYKAMLELERARLALVQSTDYSLRGLIIPIVIRGEKYLPEEIKKKRHYYDFSSFTLDSKMSENPNYAPKIKEIAEYIVELYRAFAALPQVNKDCSKFKLPPEPKIIEWLRQLQATVIEPSFPLRRGEKYAA